MLKVLTYKYRNVIEKIPFRLLTLYLLFFIEFELLHFVTISNWNIENIQNFFKHEVFVLLDISILLLIPYLFKRYTYMAIIIMHFLVSGLIISNIWYARYFNTYISVNSYFNGALNMKEFMSSILPVLKLSDLLFVFFNIIVISLFTKNPFNIKHHFKTSLFIFLLSLFGCCCFVLHRYIVTNKNVLNQIYGETLISYSEGIYNYGFFIGYSIDYIYIKSVSSLNKYPSKKVEELAPYLNSPLYQLSSTEKKNLIIIIVESFSSYSINKKYNGIEITPNINKLVKDASFFSDKIIDETISGASSDGQLIYISGLLPLMNDITVFRCNHNKFLTIPNLLVGYNKKIIIPSSEDCWKQSDMNKCYGINNMISAENSLNPKKYLSDKDIFDNALFSDKKEKGLFFSLILTSSTHTPYNHALINEKINFPNYYSDELKNYLLNVKYMDKYLGQYITSIKKIGLYDNSIIVIVGDHLPPGPGLKMGEKNPCTKLPLIILNGNPIIKRTNTYLGQSCVFPTIIDLMNIKTKWKGVGESIYMPQSIIGSDFEKKRLSLKNKISDMILCNDYFRNFHYKNK